MSTLDMKALRGRYNAIKRDALSRTDDPWRVNDDPDGFVRVHQGYALTCRLVADTMRQPVAEFVVAMHNAAPLLLDAAEERDALRARVAALQAEVDACGDIIGQPHGCTFGHAEIIEETIKEHQADNVRLAARVAELEADNARLRTPLRPIVDAIHKALGCSEYSDDESLPEMVETWIREHREKIAGLEQLVCDWQAASGLERGGDPSTIAPADCERNVQALMARVAKLEAENVLLRETASLEARQVAVVRVEKSIAAPTTREGGGA